MVLLDYINKIYKALTKYLEDNNDNIYLSNTLKFEDIFELLIDVEE